MKGCKILSLSNLGEFDDNFTKLNQGHLCWVGHWTTHNSSFSKFHLKFRRCISKINMFLAGFYPPPPPLHRKAPNFLKRKLPSCTNLRSTNCPKVQRVGGTPCHGYSQDPPRPLQHPSSVWLPDGCLPVANRSQGGRIFFCTSRLLGHSLQQIVSLYMYIFCISKTKLIRCPLSIHYAQVTCVDFAGLFSFHKLGVFSILMDLHSWSCNPPESIHYTFIIQICKMYAFR